PKLVARRISEPPVLIYVPRKKTIMKSATVPTVK
ncbi:unnamed protein product, partial [marine sediment metagenome]